MISDEHLNAYRVDGTLVRVVRDTLEMNDVIGTVVAWDEDSVVIRKANRRVIKLSRGYIFEPASNPRTNVLE